MAIVELRYLKNMYSQEKTMEEIHAAYQELITENSENLPKLMEDAIKFADATAIKMLFDAGYNPSTVDDFQFTLLHKLAKEISYTSSYYTPPVGAVAACVNLMLDNKVSVLRKDTNEGMCCYHYAARNANSEFVHAMQTRGAKLDITGKNGVTALHELASSFQHNGANTGRNPEIAARFIETAKEFIAAGIDIDAKNDYGQTAGDIVIEYKSVGLFRLLVTDPNVFQAIDIKAYDDIQDLIATDPNAIRYEDYARFDKLTALGAACIITDIRAIEIILGAGADVNFKNDAGDTALATLISVNNPDHTALKDNYYEKIFDMFVAHGWDINSEIDQNGNTLLCAAIAGNFSGGGYNYLSSNRYAIDWCLSHNADVNRANNMGQTPLMFASIGDDDKMENVHLSLLENGADVTPKDSKGKTALHYIVQNRSQNMARNMADIMLSFGKIDTNAVDNDGKTALDIATENNHEELVKFLLSKV